MTDDSREVAPGSLFVAIKGDRADGHRFIAQAVAAGASVVVMQEDVAVGASSGGAPPVAIRVRDSKEAASKLAAAYHGLRGGSNTSPAIIGITGTNGKTTVSWLLRSILRAADLPTAMIGTIEYDLITERLVPSLTTPTAMDLCRHLADARDAGAEYAVLEVSSHALAQRRTDGLCFRTAVFTNLSGDHLDYHGSMDRYLACKRRLFTGLDEGGTAILNRDDPVYESLRAGLRAMVLTYSLESGHADFTATIESTTLAGTRFTLRTPSDELPVSLRLVGGHNVQNALAAAAAAYSLGIESTAIRNGLSSLAGVPGRLQAVGGPESAFSVFVDYAHTDDALLHVLTTLRPLTRGRLICVFGCGGDRDRGKRPRMASAVQRVADVAYVTSDNPRSEAPMAIIDDVLAGFSASPSFGWEVQPDRARAIEAAIAEASPGDSVLIAGKGHETYQLVADRVLDFDDVAVARSALARRAQAEDAA